MSDPINAVLATANSGREGGFFASAGNPVAAPGAFQSVGAQGFPQVNTGAAAFARTNRGSNVRIPYSRVVPARSRSRSTVTAVVSVAHAHSSEIMREFSPTNDPTAALTTLDLSQEYDGLDAGELAWAFGRVPPKTADATDADMRAQIASGTGTRRGQRLASTAWVEAHFRSECGAKQIDLSDLKLYTNSTRDQSSELNRQWQLMMQQPQAQLNEDDYTVLHPRTNNAFNDGICTTTMSPFLSGVGVSEAMKTVPGDSSKLLPLKNIDVDGYFDNHYDVLAFEALAVEMKQSGLFAWTPDGLVINKPEDPAGDPLAAAELDVRHGMMVNVAVQGPSIARSWSGDPHMLTLPGDRVYVVIVADVVTGTEENVEKYTKAVKKAISNAVATKDAVGGDEPSDAQQAYTEAVTEMRTMLPDTMNVDTMCKLAKAAYERKWSDNPQVDGKCVMTNFRLRRVTSGFLTQHAAPMADNRLSRCGLRMNKIGETVAAEYIVGGWDIGCVLDNAASRGALSGLSLGPHATMNINVNVNVKYLSGDQLHRRYGLPCANHRGSSNQPMEFPEFASSKEEADDQKAKLDQECERLLREQVAKQAAAAAEPPPQQPPPQQPPP